MKANLLQKLTLGASLLGAVALLGPALAPLGASSHREAPLITADPLADNTDVYAFVSADAPGYLNIIANWIPVEDPNGGPNFYKFDDNAIYTIYIDHDGDARPDVVFYFDFQTTVANGNTFLYNTGPVTSLDDPDLNVKQSYTAVRYNLDTGGRRAWTNIPVAPSNVGTHSMPDYDALMRAAVTVMNDYGRDGLSFAGQIDDPFFVDLGAVFDLLTIRPFPGSVGDKGGGIDHLAGMNTHAIAIQVPFEWITACACIPADRNDPNAIVGIWSGTLRGTRAAQLTGPVAPEQLAALKQVSRLGMPLVNEVVIPMKDKDKFNASMPKDDGQFLTYVQNPELATLFAALYGISVPPTPRDDLVTVFLTGIPGLNQPPGVVPSEQLRINLMVPPCTTACSTLGVIGGDEAGFPNGRRLSDDIVDIEERVVAGVLVPGFDIYPNNALGDGVDVNDKPFQSAFPYVAAPHNGFDHTHHRLEPPRARPRF